MERHYQRTNIKEVMEKALARTSLLDVALDIPPYDPETQAASIQHYQTGEEIAE